MEYIMDRYLRHKWLYILVCLSICASGAMAQSTSPLRPTPSARNAEELGDAKTLYKTTDPQQQIVLSRQFLEKYSEGKLRGIAYRYLISALIKLNDYEQAVAMAKLALAEKPDNLSVMGEICLMGSERAHAKDFTYTEISRELCTKALNLIDAGKFPYEYSFEDWKNRRDFFLGGLHKSLGIISYYEEKWSEAADQFLMATRMVPKDPYSFYLLAKCRYNELRGAEALVAAAEPAGKAKKHGKQVVVNDDGEKYEEVLLNLARALVLSEQQEYQWLRSPVESELQFLGENLKLAKPVDTYIQAARDATNAEVKTTPTPGQDRIR
jgi:tetratricopeptide (TPR) repeat protein